MSKHAVCYRSVISSLSVVFDYDGHVIQRLLDRCMNVFPTWLVYCIAVTLGGQVHQDRYMTDVWLCNCDTYVTICDSVSVCFLNHRCGIAYL